MLVIMLQELTTWCFNLTGNTRVCSLRANKVPRMAGTVLRLLPSITNREDVVILNLGAWCDPLALKIDTPMWRLSNAVRVGSARCKVEGHQFNV